MKHAIPVNVVARDHTEIVDAVGAGAPHHGVGTRNVKFSELTIGSAHEAVSPVTVIRDGSRDYAQQIDTR